MNKQKAESKTGSMMVFRSALLRLIDSRLRYNNVDGIIKAVDETDYTADVLIGQTLFTAVPLRIIVTEQASFIEIPKLETPCIVIFRGMDNGRPAILEVHECTKILQKVGTSVFNMTDTGFVLDRGSSGLKKTLSDLIDAINQMTVTTGTGPSGTPINATQFTSIKNDLDNYLI